MPPRRKPLRRAHSSTTHVCDSEPEREDFRTNLIGARSSTSSFNSSAPDTPPTERPPLSSLSNTVLNSEPITSRAIHERLSAMEGVLCEIKMELSAQRRHSACCWPWTRCLLMIIPERRPSGGPTPTSSPAPKRMRAMKNQCVGDESPVGRLEEPRIHRSSLMVSTPERAEISRCLYEGFREAHQRRRPTTPTPSGSRNSVGKRANS
ncbi:hypothetical protein DFH06DRAFT_1243124 [Mycena polygramma]|nr:hypothetical protein DFH06DRAFT_1243124 [Mycena polygramma]